MLLTTEQDLVLSGGRGTLRGATRYGFLPVPLRHSPTGSLRNIAVYLRNDTAAGGKTAAAPFALYRSADVAFTHEDRERLLAAGRDFVYLRMSDQAQYHAQTERAVADAMTDPSLAQSEKSHLVYETTVEVINEVLADPNMAAHSQRLEGISRSICSLVLNDVHAFRHLFTVSHHDFYTATHMVNVATWMVPLAYALGYRKDDELAQVCQAGLLHDIGKIFVPDSVLNQRGRLSAEQWQLLREHPLQGWIHLAAQASFPPIVLDACRQHHERPDGSGYPDGLKADRIGRIAKLAAVVDSFDAMTALRPFKERSLTVSDAILELQAGVPRFYEREIVEAWVSLLRDVHDSDLRPLTASGNGLGQDERRRDKRYECKSAGIVSELTGPGESSATGGDVQVSVHNLSRFGFGLLSPQAAPVGSYLRLRVAGGRVIDGQVVRCREHSDGTFEIGMAMLKTERSA